MSEKPRPPQTEFLKSPQPETENLVEITALLSSFIEAVNACRQAEAAVATLRNGFFSSSERKNIAQLVEEKRALITEADRSLAALRQAYADIFALAGDFKIIIDSLSIIPGPHAQDKVLKTSLDQWHQKSKTPAAQPARYLKLALDQAFFPSEDKSAGPEESGGRFSKLETGEDNLTSADVEKAQEVMKRATQLVSNLSEQVRQRQTEKARREQEAMERAEQIIKAEADRAAKEAFKRFAESGEHRLIVSGAQNPYREALRGSGLPNIEQHPLAAEKRDLALDLIEILGSDQESYRSAGLTAWAKDVAKFNWSQLTAEKFKIIEQEIADGAIPIFMPGRLVQLDTTVEDFTKRLKPTWIKEGEQQAVADAYRRDYFANLIKDKATELVKDVPTRPYLSLQKPTQNPEPRTCNKTVPEQLEEFASIQKTRESSGKSPVYVTSPAEYAALQKRFTERVSTLCETNNLKPNTINPLDSNTWTRFISLAVSSVGSVPNGYFNPGDRQLNFNWSNAGSRHSRTGFRLSVREEF